MRPVSGRLRLHIQRIGEAARRLLDEERRGQVLAVFSHAAYLVVEPEELVWLTPVGALRHQRCLQAAGPWPELEAGSGLFVEGRCMYIEPNITLDFGQSLAWQAPHISFGDVLEIAEIPERVRTVYSTGLASRLPKGLGTLISDISLLSENQPINRQPGKGDPIVSFAWPAIQEIAQACLSHDVARIFQKAGDLVGLGAGLTPSGDDFLGGLLFCLYHLRQAYPDFLNAGSPDQVSYVETRKSRTHLISFTILRDLAGGHAVEPLHDFINILLTRQPPERIQRPISRLVSIGHSTGWDLLTGTLTAMLMTFQTGAGSTEQDAQT